MKCVREIQTSTINRVADDLANKLVMAGTHEYAKKSEWKLQVRPPKTLEK